MALKPNQYTLYRCGCGGEHEVQTPFGQSPPSCAWCPKCGRQTCVKVPRQLQRMKPIGTSPDGNASVESRFIPAPRPPHSPPDTECSP